MRLAKILAVQAVVIFALLEIALRIHNPLPFRVMGSHLVLPVHRRYVFQHEGAKKLDPVTYHSKNSLGFRGPDPPPDFSMRLTIVTIGGSTTEGLFLSDGRTWTDVVARRLARVRPGVWVNNAGLDGQSTFGHLALVRDVIAALKPAMAVFFVGINDVGLASDNEYDASMRSSWLPWRERWNPYDTRFVARRTPWHDEWAFLSDHSEIFGLIENVMRVRRARSVGFSHEEWDLATRPALALDRSAVDAGIAPARPALDGYAARLRDLIALCRVNGIVPVFVTQPLLVGDASDVDPATGVNLGTIMVRPGENGAIEWGRLVLYNDVTRRVAAEAHVPLLDAAGLAKDSRLYYDFMHNTNEGAERLGARIADGLEPLVTAR